MDKPIFPLLVGLISALFALLISPAIRAFSIRIGCVAHPHDDRWGRRIVSRLGGIPIALMFLSAIALYIPDNPHFWGFLGAGVIMFLVGLVDDLKQLNPYVKLIGQIMASCLVVLSGTHIVLPWMWVAIPATILWIVFVTNAFNLMDNMDGLAGGIGIIAAIFCYIHAAKAGNMAVATISMALAGATLGFLRYNIHPAKIFMGDTGSQVLGLGLSVLTLLGPQNGSPRLLGIVAMPTLLLAIPILDTSFVILQRLINKRSPFQGGTDHLSHRLGILGLSTRQVMLSLCVLALLLGSLSLVVTEQGYLSSASIWLFSLGILLLFGAYLSRVRVYTAEEQPADETRVAFLETMLMYKRRILEVFIDFVLICGSFILAFALRFEGGLTPDLEQLIFQALPFIIIVKMLCFVSCGLYRTIWKYTSIPDVGKILKATVLGSLCAVAVAFVFWRFEGYSRAVFVIDGLILFVTVSGARLTERIVDEWIAKKLDPLKRILIVGAGDSGELLLRQFKAEKNHPCSIVGFVDDSPKKQGDQMHGVEVIGTRRDLGQLLKQHHFDAIYIAISDPPEGLIEDVESFSKSNGVDCYLFHSTAAKSHPLNS